ncbi:VWA domain-containing protein [Vibrio fortis]
MLDSLVLQQVFTQFHFIRPLWLLAFIPMFFLLWLRWREETKPSWKDVLPEHLRNALTIGERGWRKQLPLKLLMVIVAIAILICAGPTWQREASPFGEDKASMLVVLDNSETMLLKDLPPSRLERSKQKIRDLLAARNGGNTGLVVYSGSAHVAMPVTQDSKVFEPFLAAITPEIMPVAGKIAETALPLIDQQLNSELGSTVLLVTDGVNPATIKAYETFFNDKPYQLLILAAGNRDIVSDNPVDLSGLNDLASATGGRVIEVTVDDADIQALNRAVERNMQLNGESAMPWKDMGYGLLFPIALIMLLWFRKGWLVQWCVVGVLVTGSQEYLEAAKHFQDPLRKGVAYYYAREFKLAHSAFLQTKTDLGVYYSATALARQREYLAARDLLKSLLEKPDLDNELAEKVEHNLAVFNGIVEEVNRMSESQAGTTDGPEESFELDEDKPRTGDGAEEETVAELMLKETLNANEILGSQELADKWLKRVEADPKYFLKAKFQIQLREPKIDVEQESNNE